MIALDLVRDSEGAGLTGAEVGQAVPGVVVHGFFFGLRFACFLSGEQLISQHP